jgi:hypothetical protein
MEIKRIEEFTRRGLVKLIVARSDASVAEGRL